MFKSYNYDTSFIGDTDKGVNSSTPFTPGITTNKALLTDERARVDAREKFGMPTAGAASMTGAAIGTEGANRQESLASRLKAIAAGGPSAGQSAMYANNDAAKRAMMASAFGKPGGAAGMRAARTTGNQAAYMDAATARQADIIGAQEQQAAMAQYGQLGAAMRSADIANADEYNRINMANAGFQQSAALANQDAALRWQQVNDQQKRMLLGMGVDLNQNEWDNRLGYYGAMRNREMDWLNARRQKDQMDNEKSAQAFMTVASAAAAASDRRSKTDIEPGDKDVSEFLSSIGAHSYRYKDPHMDGAAPGRHVSPMAQEIESTTIGRSAVKTGPDGVRRVDYARLIGAVLAGESYLHDRLNKLEGRG